MTINDRHRSGYQPTVRPRRVILLQGPTLRDRRQQPLRKRNQAGIIAVGCNILLETAVYTVVHFCLPRN